MSLDKVFVALDQMSEEEINVLLLDSPIRKVKIGLELFLLYGPELIHRISTKFNVRIFLDLKLHDIPVTVSKAIKSLKGLPIDYLTVHLSGGSEMLKEALLSAKENIPSTKILGVSFLTSLENSDLMNMFGIELNDEAFSRLFKLALNNGIHGVVCSPREITLLKKIAPNIQCVTPGVRFQFEIDNQENIGDQKRILSAEDAFKSGADFIVMGRSLTKCLDRNELNKRLALLKNI
jgi:orotidine-5'-phosphate decarboxylase